MYEVIAKCRTCEAKEVVHAEGEIPKDWILALEPAGVRSFICPKCQGRFRVLFREGAVDDPVRKAVDLTLENERLVKEVNALKVDLLNAKSEVEYLKDSMCGYRKKLEASAAAVRDLMKTNCELAEANVRLKEGLQLERNSCAALRRKVFKLLPAKPTKNPKKPTAPKGKRTCK